MTVREFADDYIENYGRRMVLLAQVSGEQKWQRLGSLYNNMSNAAFILCASSMACLLVKHKMLFRAYFSKDCWDWLKEQKEWSNLDRHMTIACHESVIQELGEKYGLC